MPTIRRLSLRRHGHRRLRRARQTKTTYSWDPDGNLLTQVAADGVTTTKTYGIADDLVSIEHEGPSGTPATWDDTRTGAATSRRRTRAR